MADTRITSLRAIEILDSRGIPTVQVTVTLADGTHGTSSVPSGASTGSNEVVELRDADPRRYRGKGVLRAVEQVHTEIAPALAGMDATRQADIDHRMRELDGTPRKARLGANAILGVSQACARAAARATGLPLYLYLGGEQAVRLPMPMVNILNGGKHADNGLDIQEFMIVPLGAGSLAEGLRFAVETFHALQCLLRSRGYTVAVGDEGGFAPLLESNEQAFEIILEAIEAAGFRPGQDIALAIDAAATTFHEHGRYRLSRTTYRNKTSAEMTQLYRHWITSYPIVSIEDGLAEDDWDGFSAMTAALGAQVRIVGDDLLVTDTRFIARAIEARACNAALIKLNQIGTVSEAIAAVERCRQAGWGTIVANRSGETIDGFMADFAVAMNAGQIKAGSVCRGERVAKYNRLLEIAHELGPRARFGRT
jgi:enolase